MARLLAYGRDGATRADEQLTAVARWGHRAGHEVTMVIGVGRMLDACRERRVDLVGVTALSRLANSPGVLGAVLHILGRATVDIAVVSDDGNAVVYVPGSPELAASAELGRAYGELAHEEWLDWGGARRPRRIDARWLAGWRPRRPRP